MPETFPRVMWLLNHTSARKFELAMLKRLGFQEIFLPKSFPQDIGFRSASVDTSEDASLSIPADDLALLNETDWYGQPGRDVWQVANRHFDLMFCMVRPNFLRVAAQHFEGAAILRAYGFQKGNTYSATIRASNRGLKTVEDMGRRFWLGAAYHGIAEVESSWMKSREVLLPVGLEDCQMRDAWTGTNPKILFICPDIEGIAYYAKIYREFKTNFAGFPYAVGGAQALATNDPNVLGYLPEDQHQRNMHEFRVMYYHSTEPNHVHYHPFEAVRAGMPLVFMAGGLLDKLGGSELPGRCRNYDEARSKLRKILNGDRGLIDRIRASQPVLLEKMRPEGMKPAWRDGLRRVLSDLEIARVPRPSPTRRRRIAVVVPVAYRGGTLRSAKLLAHAIWKGSRKFSEEVDLVFAYPAEDAPYADDPAEHDIGLSGFASRRAIEWQVLEADSAQRAMRYAGHADWVPASARYLVPDDGMQNLCDCDLWIVISDRLSLPLLPIRPYAMMIFDYVHRYDALTSRNDDIAFVLAARFAKRVLVTTRFTEQDALTYAGLAREKVFRVPMLAPRFAPPAGPLFKPNRPYFLWATNLGLHKNHYAAFCALRAYYEEFGGRLDCYISGVDTTSLLSGSQPHLARLKPFVQGDSALSRRLRIMGELPDADYRTALAGATFLWHPARIDNGSLAVVEAAFMGVPSLSSRYAAMEEMNDQFQLRLWWMESTRPSDMGRQLKWLEEHLTESPARQASELPCYDADQNAAAYWSVIRECL
jgi:glycosyltransferase involved in cell wall biosynthesis